MNEASTQAQTEATTLSTSQVAKYLCERSGWTLTNLELQKLVYLISMAYIGHHNGRPLVRESFEAWDYGPVEPELYRRLKVFGRANVMNVFHAVPDIADPEQRDFIDRSYRSLQHFSPAQLVSITHSPNAAWYAQYTPSSRGLPIPRAAMISEYQARRRVTRR